MALAVFLHLSLSSHAVWAYGESDGFGRPAMEERTLLVLTNQIRQAPHEWPDWDTSLSPGAALKPLDSHVDLFRSARFHAEDMATHNHFAHESFDGTPFSSRIQRFFGGASGENIYKATNLDPYRAMTAWMNSEGHRINILHDRWTWLGTGYALAAPFHYYVQNFGHNSEHKPALIPAATAFAARAGTLRLLANFYDPAGKKPGIMRAMVGPRCVNLSLTAGTEGNGTYLSDQTSPSECVGVIFWAQSQGDPKLVRYPSSGALMYGPGCSTDFDATDNTMDCGESEKPPEYIDAVETGCHCVPGERPHGVAVLLLLGLCGLRSTRRSRQASFTTQQT